MANKLKIKTTGDVKVTIGPTMETDGSLPANPAYYLRMGQLGTRVTPDQTIRRAFSVPYRPSLHRSAGLSNDEFNQPGHEDRVGNDPNKYSQGENPETTSEGQPIRGT